MRELPKIARDRLAAAQVSTPHLDPNLISGFLERSLLPDERERVIAHMSICEQCRGEVQLVIGTTQADVRSVAAAGAEVRPSHRGFLWQRLLRWQPVTAALAVAAVTVAVFVSTRQRVSKVTHPAATAPVAMVSKPAPPPSPPGTAGNASVQLQAGVPPKEVKQKAGPSIASPREAAAAKLALAKQLKSKVGAGEVSAQLVSGSATAPPVEQAEDRQLVVAAPPPPQPASVPAPQSSATAQPAVPQGVNESGQAGAMPAHGVERAPVALSVGANFAAKSAMAPRQMMRAVRPPVRWTVNADATAQVNQGAVERSIDGGRTWLRVPVAEGVTFRVVFALGRNVWSGGAAGAFYHSSDGGEHWSSIPLAATATAVGTAVGDIVSIQFADATHGVVSTSTGVTWTTSDGGQTWKQAPQN